MNQSILFPDIQTWNEELQAVVFPAQQAGALIECVVSLVELSRLAAQPIDGEQQALAIFQTLRFDLEEIAEALIEEEDYNQRGQIDVIS
ncbi:DUF1488 domain-containing protein [Vibrio furnissii]|uniref:DUF1488 domain-containing protein n=1 Tax=Vibrio furnissii TaxID=29494 RepID=UPI002572F83B|nr:DUF1488 domain-containing protein [Vibrio furnissii]WJG21675.1 DUF1488 domain-containing protein [Vibrio furnissii]